MFHVKHLVQTEKNMFHVKHLVDKKMKKCYTGLKSKER